MEQVLQINSENCGNLLSNPDRGLRMEHYITLGSPVCSYPLDGTDPFERAQTLIEKYKPDSPTLCQLYVYLSNYRRKSLDVVAFEQLKRIFELYRENNVRLLLRFAYSTGEVTDAPYRTVKKHLAQIKDWFNENRELVSDTLYCMQTGIIGLWGEGHSNKHLKNRHIKKVIRLVREVTPQNVYVQVRTFDMLKKVCDEDKSKTGIHDDYIIGDMNHKWSFIPQSQKEEFSRTCSHAKFTVNDGEMPWGRATLDDKEGAMPLNSLDGKDVLKQLSAFYLTSFSLEHNYREDDGKQYSMAKWKTEYLSYGEAVSLGITVNPGLFKNSKKEDTNLSIYDIIRYHLGYQLALADYDFQDGTLSFTVTNYGFAAPLNFNYLAVVFQDENGVLSEIEVENYDKKQLLSGKSVTYTVTLPEKCEPVGVKTDTQKGAGVNPRFANSTDFSNGIQYFK